MTRKRSPAYPAIALEKAIDRARTIYCEEHDNLAPVEAVLTHWKFGVNSGAGMAQIAALKHYGLLVERKTKKGRQVKLSGLALDIVLDDREESAFKISAIGRAALNPKLHAELWAMWGDKLPSQATARLFLIRERKFHPDYADKAFRIYTDTIAFAKPEQSDIILENNKEEPNDTGKKDPIKVGDYVQWSSQGAAQFPEPRRVLGLSDDGDWAFVEGSDTGIAIAELTVEIHPPEAKKPLPNPFVGKGMILLNHDTFTFSPGKATFSWPNKLTSADYDDLKDWTTLVLKKIKRSLDDEANE